MSQYTHCRFDIDDTEYLDICLSWYRTTVKNHQDPFRFWLAGIQENNKCLGVFFFLSCHMQYTNGLVYERAVLLNRRSNS